MEDHITGERENNSDDNNVMEEVLERNLKTLSHSHPAVYEFVTDVMSDNTLLSNISLRETPEGIVIYDNGICMDHPTKPILAGEIWAKQVITDTKFTSATEIYVYGLGSGYHISKLMEITAKPIHILEPSIGVFISAIKTRDLCKVFKRAVSLHVGTKAIEALNFSEGQDLVVRPQAQAVYSETCSLVLERIYGVRGLRILTPKVGIVGPTQGGTLPILAYCQRALSMGNYRNMALDMSPYANGYHQIEALIPTNPRKDIAQAKYVNLLSEMIEIAVDESPVDILLCMAQAPITGETLERLRKKGIITVLWFVEDFLRFTYWQVMAKHYDYVFTIQKEPCISAIKKAGAGHVEYLPLACDPAIHAPMPLSEEEKERWGSSVSFVGAGYHNRTNVFPRLAHLDFKIWGTEWPEHYPFSKLVQEGGRRLTPAEYVKIFNASQVNINLHSSAERNGVDPTGDFVNPRTFELAACGAFQLVDHRSLLGELFEVGREIVTFRDTDDLLSKIDYYLNNPHERMEIAKRARQRAISEHTYQNRIKKMLKVIYGRHFDRLYTSQVNSPWHRLLEAAKYDEELYERFHKAYMRGDPPKLESAVKDIVMGEGSLSDTERKLLFLHHIQSQIKYMKQERKENNGV